MNRIVLDCGNCGPDFNSIRQMIRSNFGASVIQSHGIEDTLQILKEKKIDLVMVNRKLDRDYTDGMEVVRAIKSDLEVSSVPVMLVTNYEEHQEAAMKAGCVVGFGKLAIDEEATRKLLLPYLGETSKAPS